MDSEVKCHLKPSCLLFIFFIPLNLHLQSTLFDISVIFVIKGETGSYIKPKWHLSGSAFAPPTSSDLGEWQTSLSLSSAKHKGKYLWEEENTCMNIATDCQKRAHDRVCSFQPWTIIEMIGNRSWTQSLWIAWQTWTLPLELCPAWKENIIALLLRKR